MDILILMLYGWLGAKGKKLAGQNKAFTKWRDRISGLALIGICINLFFIKRSAT
jgi:threonine/homoserine/homoserine lactone efflux protein